MPIQMKKFLVSSMLVFITSIAFGQIVVITPSSAGADEIATIIFDAAQGNKELMGASKVYMHHGVVTDKANGTAWKYVKGNWGSDDGIGEMTKVEGEANKWKLVLTPSIRAYFGVPVNENIFRISTVFRSADGNTKGTINPGEYGWGTVTSNLDIYINLNNDNYITFNAPVAAEGFVDQNQSLFIQGAASSEVTNMTLWLDEGSGFESKATVTSGKSIQYQYMPTSSVDLDMKLTATINGEALEIIKNYNLSIKKSNNIAPLPSGMMSGINYDEADPTKATLVLLAPHKEFVYVVGDFSDWKIKDEYQMNQTPDGEYYWISIEGLTPNKDYVYQYWIDGRLKIADPYTHQVADPWNDQWIESTVFPNIPEYNKTEFGLASVLRTNQQSYTWSQNETNWNRPDVNHLVIYELHIRDFIASHSYQGMIDTIQYIKKLGVNAIELMPINEFEGNDSWGYNPSFFFATDKYYGTKEKLKEFIDVAHQNGMAVIMDIVLNHSFGQSPMVQMYFEGGKPAANNPWFNREYVGQYQWGYDFNHESPYTEKFVDDVNKFWLEEFHFDGYRFDFTKGFTNYAPGGSVDGFDQSRINILKRMSDKLWDVDPTAYVILEHWGPTAEESQLGALGMKMWRNKSYDFVPATIGSGTGTFANTDATTHVTLYNSHDERRIAEHCLTEGLAIGSYNIKDSIIMYERVKKAAAFSFLQPGPKMMWQFDELGYDIDINFNGRVGRKPYVWGNGSLKYYNSALRQNIYKAYKGILHVRNTIGPDVLKAAQKSHIHTGNMRRLNYNTNNIDLVVIGNFGLTPDNIVPKFTQTGKWYNYFKGDSTDVIDVNQPIRLQPGEWHIYTTERLAEGQPNVIGIYDNPVTITPYPFKGNDLIKITFDAKKASPGGTNGLLGVDKVYMHSGVKLSTATTNDLTNIVGSFADDGIGLMTKVGEDIWELTITPNEYYSIVQDQEIYNIGMWFRDADNTNRGYGFRDGIIYFDVQSDQPIVTVTPPNFEANTEITITFNARVGNRELIGADKVYMHSGVGVVDTDTPNTSAWNKVVGNWGQDDGIGQMTKVAGETDKWQIKLTPNTYYGLGTTEFPYWIAAVFRSGDGSRKGTGAPGPIENGYIASNLDFFLQNQKTVGAEDIATSQVIVSPNPTTEFISFNGLEHEGIFTLFSTEGKVVFEKTIVDGSFISIKNLNTGMYFYQIRQGGKVLSGKLIKQ